MVGLISVAALLPQLQPAQAATGINQQMNYQGRLLNAAGAVVPDGTYNIEFKMYSGGTGCVASGVSPCGGTNIWTEDWVYGTGAPDNRLVVRNGYFSVQLGALSSLSAVNLAQDTLWISINIGNTTTAASFATASGDGEMLPFKRLSAGAYAFTANQLAVYNSGNTFSSTLNIVQPTGGSQLFQIPDQGAAGTYNLLTTSAAATGYIQLQGGTPGTAQTGNLNITGTGLIGTALTTPILQSAAGVALLVDSGTTGALNVGTGANAKTITIGNATGASSVVINAGTGPVSIGTNATDHSTTLGSTTGVSATTIQAGSAGISLSAAATTVTGNLTVAASKYVKLTGDITANRPAAPTAGMVFYDTTTNQLLQWNGTKWVSDHSTSTKIVAASNSTQANKDAADYIATGTGDQATINTALTAASGGLVYLMEGTYNVSAGITIPTNTTLAGAGGGSLITIPNTQNLTYNIITNAASATHIAIRDLMIDGNKANNASASMNGIYLNGMGSGSGTSAVDGAKLTNLIVRNMAGATTAGILLNNSNNNTLTGNTSQGNATMGIYIFSSSNNTVTGNTSQGNGNVGIYVSASSNTTVTGNFAQGNTYGIFLSGSSNNTVTGNTSMGNAYGIYIGNSSSNNTFTGNTVQGNSFGIYLGLSSNNTVSSNKVHDSGVVTTNNGIYIQNTSSQNSITGNDITDTSCTTTCYAINIFDAGSTGNYLADNHHSGTAANPSTIFDAGTGTIYANQPDGSGNLINKSQGGGLTVGAASATATLTLQGGLVATALPTPAAPTLAVFGTTGAISRTYAVSALDGSGETLISTTATSATTNTTLTGANYVAITWAQVSGAVQYKVYRTSVTGTNGNTAGTIGTVSGNILTFNDTGIVASGSTPAANTTGGASLAALLQGTTAKFTGTNSLTVGQASTAAGSIVFNNATNANTVTIVSGVTSGTYQITLPTAIAGSNQCLQSGTVAGGNIPLTFGACGTSGTFVNLQGSSPGTADTGSINLTGTIISAILKVGDVTNGITLDPSTGPDYHGTARPTKRISQSPEFLGAVLRGDGSSNTGTLTTSFDATNFHNYYNWTTNQGTNQDFDVATRVAIPNDFSSLTLSPQLCMYGWSDDLTNGTITANVNDSSNTAITLSSSSFTPGSASTWAETCRTISGSPTLTAGGFITLRVTIQAANTKNTRLGEFRIDYLGKF